jgi:hypothetical protein
VKPGIIGAVLLLAGSILSAEPGDDIFRYPLAYEGTGRFREICVLLSEHPVIKGTFEQEKTISSLNRSLISRGNFIIAADLGMAWETLKPFPSTMVTGRDFLIQSRPGGQKTKLDARGNETFLRLADVISSVFSGNSQGLLDNFENFFTEGGGGGTEGSAWEMGLIPLDTSIRSFAAKISMTGDRAIRFILIREQNGDTIRYSLSNHSYPPALSDDEKALFILP